MSASHPNAPPPAAADAGLWALPGYRRLLGSTASWFAAQGVHNVLVAWLLVGELALDPGWVGTVQMAQTLPFLGLLLVGGVVADRVRRPLLLAGLHLGAALSAGVLAGIAGGGTVGLSTILAYVLVFGTLQAFNHPTRDAMISDVAPRQLAPAITGLTLVQFGAVAAGSGLAGFTEPLGSARSLLMMAGIALVGALPLLALRGARLPSARRQPAWSAIASGLAVVRHSAVLGPATLFVAANGLLFLGPYMVLCPLLVRDVYAGGRFELALPVAALTLGTMAGSSWLLWRGGPRRPRVVFRNALVAGGGCIAALALAPPFPLFVLLVFGWGIAHAYFFNTSRALFQQHAPPEQLSRVLSIHSLFGFGMAPISNLGAGLLAAWIGPLAACAVCGGAMWIVVAVGRRWFRAA